MVFVEELAERGHFNLVLIYRYGGLCGANCITATAIFLEEAGLFLGHWLRLLALIVEVSAVGVLRVVEVLTGVKDLMRFILGDATAGDVWYTAIIIVFLSSTLLQKLDLSLVGSSDC